MSRPIVRIASLRTVDDFRDHLRANDIEMPCDSAVDAGNVSPLAQPLQSDGLYVGNRFAVQPMEGWDGTLDGKPTELTLRRWRRFGASGAKLIWGGEAAAVREDGRANPNQLLVNEANRSDLENLRRALVGEHRPQAGRTDGLVIGLQLTHSGRYSHAKPCILYRHPLLDRRLGLPRDYPILTDGDVRAIIESFHSAARIAYAAGFDFVDIKHCHGYLGHEFLSAHTRDGDYGGEFENRTRFLREIVEGIRASVPSLGIGVRFSAFDGVSFDRSGRPEIAETLLPYRWGFGVNKSDPLNIDLEEPVKFLALLRRLDIRLVNVTAASPYYNPHLQRPALFPPSDGYLPPEDPLIGVARQMKVTQVLKTRFPELSFVGTGYSYLQEFMPNVAQAAVRLGWVDFVGLGRMALSYPELPLDVLRNRPLDRRRLCRTFSDCTTAPRNKLPSGCYPLDNFYRDSTYSSRLKEVKESRR
jgi:2,4-dienoyl-CoA reductase-like NADH-dependent reductase (Old Yellow Enzyme family)